MKKYNYIVAALMTALSGYIFYGTSSYKIGRKLGQDNPAAWPRFLAVMLIVLSVALVIETIFKKNPEDKEEKPPIEWKSPGMIRVYIMLGLMVAFWIVMKYFGMLIALFLLIPCIELVMGCKNKLMLIVLPVALTLFCYLFFVVIMKITLPQPFWA